MVAVRDTGVRGLQLLSPVTSWSGMQAGKSGSLVVTELKVQVIWPGKDSPGQLVECGESKAGKGKSPARMPSQ